MCTSRLSKYSILSHRTSSEKGITFVNILIIAVTLVVVAVPEGNSPAHTNIPELIS